MPMPRSDQPGEGGRASHATVVTIPSPRHTDPAGHEAGTLDACAQRLADYLGVEYAGRYDPAAEYRGRLYFVPGETLVGSQTVPPGSLEDERDLYGGVVPYAFVATKTITHPLFDAGAHAPPGWSKAFPAQVRDVVLDGFSAFRAEDAWRAGKTLLAQGEVRVKPAHATGGCGQTVVRTGDDLVAARRVEPADRGASA